MYNDYKSDIRACRDYLQLEDGNGLIKCVDFVLATIQQQFHTVPNILHEWKDQGENAATCWGMKKDGYLYIRRNLHRLHALVRYEVDQNDPVGVMDTLLEVPGLNTIKAGFVAQMYGLNVGCLDTHNEKLYDTDAASFYITQGLSARLRIARIESYVDFCNRIGPAEAWWGRWCEFMAAKYPQHYDLAEEVSDQHLRCLRI